MKARLMARLWLIWLMPLATLAGCAGRGASFDPAGGSRAAWVAELPALEQEAATRPDDPGALGRLALAYFMADRFEEAAATAARAREVNPRDGTACYVEALLFERAGDWRRADEIYAARETLAPISVELERLMRARHEIAAREIIRAGIKADLAAAHGRAPEVEPNALVVRRFLPVSAARRDSVLAVGITHFFTQAFAEIDTLTVIDETRRRLLEDEIALSSSDALDPGARLVARTIGAGLALAGRSGTDFPDSDRVAIVYQLDDLALEPKSESWRGTREMVRIEAPTRYILTDVGREVVRIAQEQLHLSLAPAVAARLAQPPTKAFAAFMAYSEGLLDEGRREYGKAFERYREAARIDPGFAWAGAAAERVAGAGERGEALPPAETPPSGEAGDLEQQATEIAGQQVDDVPTGHNEQPSPLPPLETERVRIVVRPR